MLNTKISAGISSIIGFVIIFSPVALAESVQTESQSFRLNERATNQFESIINNARLLTEAGDANVMPSLDAKFNVVIVGDTLICIDNQRDEADAIFINAGYGYNYIVNDYNQISLEEFDEGIVAYGIDHERAKKFGTFSYLSEDSMSDVADIVVTLFKANQCVEETTILVPLQ